MKQGKRDGNRGMVEGVVLVLEEEAHERGFVCGDCVDGSWWT